MANVAYTAIFEQARDGTWTGYVPDLPLVLGTGVNKADAVADLQLALELWMEDMKARRQPIPPSSKELIRIEVAA